MKSIAANMAEWKKLLAEPQDQSEAKHIVHFYRAGTFLCDAVAKFVAAGLVAGEKVLLISSAKHNEAILDRLVELEAEVLQAVGSGQLLLLDADASLARLMVNGRPDRQKFEEFIEAILPVEENTQTRIYGEMVNLLWSERKLEATLALEKLWCEFVKERGISLLCGYDSDLFAQEIHGLALKDVCSCHSHVIPDERDQAHALSRLVRKKASAGLDEILAAVKKLANSRGSEKARRELAREISAKGQELSRFLESETL